MPASPSHCKGIPCPSPIPEALIPRKEGQGLAIPGLAATSAGTLGDGFSEDASSEDTCSEDAGSEDAEAPSFSPSPDVPSDATELFARALHYNSLRVDKPFVVENCGAMPDELLASELFGHKKGSFTGAINDHEGLFEQADGGTIFLDEIGEISPAFQVKLLRVLQEREVRRIGEHQRRKVNVRIIASTNRDLEEEVRAGRFRQDLYFRLAEVTLELPSLDRRYHCAILIDLFQYSLPNRCHLSCPMHDTHFALHKYYVRQSCDCRYPSLGISSRICLLLLI